MLHIKNLMRYLVFWSSVLQHSKHEECHRGALRNFSMTLLNAGTVKTSSLHGTNAAPDGALPTDPWEAMASRAGLSPQGGEVQAADAQDDGAAFWRRLSRKNTCDYLRCPTVETRI